MMPNYNPEKLFWSYFKPEPKKSSAIPKIIHQMWLGGNPPSELMETWKKHNPDWGYILWTEQNLKNWRFANQYHIDNTKELNGKCDIMRYEILHQLGGFFVDADTYCLRPLNEKLFMYDSVSVYESEKHRGGLIACGFMACQPKCKLMELCIKELNQSQSPAWWYVGPAFFTHIVQKYKYPIKIYPSHYFIPKHYSGEMYAGAGPVYCDHLWGNTLKSYDLFRPKKLLKTQKPKSQQILQTPQVDHISCRRMGIGRILLQYLKDRKSVRNSTLYDLQYIQTPISASQPDKSVDFS